MSPFFLYPRKATMPSNRKAHIPAPHPDDYLFDRPRAVRLAQKVPAPEKLPRAIESIIYAMVNGVSETLFPDKPIWDQIAPGMPLSGRQAGFALGISQIKIDYWMRQRVFKDALREAVTARRHAEEPENIRCAIEIRDNKGDGSPERDNTRLKAISAIRIKEPAPAVNVSLSQTNQTNNQTNVITPGYVIKLDGG